MKMKYIGIVAVMAVLCVLAAPVLGEKNANAGPKGDQTCCINPDCQLNCEQNCEQNSNGPQNQGDVNGKVKGFGHPGGYRNKGANCPYR
jgi:hypothetical protein